MADSKNMETAFDAQDSKTETKKGCDFSGMGVLFMISSTFFFSLANLFVKMIQSVHPTQISLSRMSVQFLLLLPLVTYKKNEEDILGKQGLRKYLWVRGICGGTGILLMYMSISYLPVADAVSIAYSKIIMVPFIARVFLKEKLSRIEIALAIFSLVGVVLVAQPSFIFPSSLTGRDALNLMGVMFAFLSAMLQASSVVVLRKLGKTYAPLTVTYYSICGAVITLTISALLGELRLPCHNDLPFLFSIGFIGVTGQSLLTLGVQRVRAGTASVLQSFQVIFIYLLQILILGTVPSVLSIIGTSCLLVSGITLGIKKGRKKKK